MAEVRILTHGPPIFPRSVDGRIPDADASPELLEARRLWADVQARQAREAREAGPAMATSDTTINPVTGLAACCNDPQNRRTSTIDPALVAKAAGGMPGLQLCAVCGRKHYTFLITPQGLGRG